MEKGIALDFDLEGRKVEGAGLGVEDGGGLAGLLGEIMQTRQLALCAIETHTFHT